MTALSYRVILIIILGCLLSCRYKAQEPKSNPAVDSVEVFALKKDLISKSLSLPIELKPWERAEVFAKVDGYVREVKVDIGDPVRKNDALIILDAPEVSANYARSAAELQGAKADYQTSRDLYQRTLIASKEKGAVSESELERLKNQMMNDSSSFEAAQAAAVASSQLKNYLVIRAAFDGVITARNADPGNLVGKDRTPMMVLENAKKLRLHMAIPEAYTSALPESNSITFIVDAEPSRKYSALLVRKSNSIDLKTRTELWEFEVPNSKGDLKSGMYGTATIGLKRSDLGYAVPYTAVVTTLERKFVIRVQAGKAEWVDVRTGINSRDKIEIFGDLEENDLLLLKPNEEIFPGRPIIARQIR